MSSSSPAATVGPWPPAAGPSWTTRLWHSIRATLPHGRALPEPLWRTRHRGIQILLWINIVGIAAFGVIQGYPPLHVANELGIPALVALLATRERFSFTVRATLASLGLLLCSAMLVHLSGGYIEMHFHFFVMIAVITLYQAWPPFLIAIAYVVIHHGLLGTIDPASVYNHPDAWAYPWKWALIHGVFVLCASAAGVAAWRLNEAARDRAELLLNSVGEGIAGVTPQGVVTFVNPAIARITGWDEEQLIGRSLHQLMHHRSPEGASYPPEGCPVCEAIDAGRAPMLTEGMVRSRDGSPRPVEYAATPVFEQGRRTGAVVTFKDVSEQKQVEAALQRSEDQLRQAQKMEAIGRLAGGVAHDFNNLLTVMNGFSELVLMHMPAVDPQREYMEQVLQAGERARSLVSQLLAFSRQQPVAPVVLDMNQVVSEMEKLLARVLGEDIRLQTELTHDLGRVEADPGQMEQIILNLAVNARDAMPDGGTLTIETANVHFEPADLSHRLTLQPGPYVMLSVSDTGHGMDAATRDRIFEPFFTTKGLGKGTGLGLSTVFGIVQQSGGDIWVYSEPGHGTTFKVYLPQQDARSGQPLDRATPDGSPARGSETVLVVEDEPGVRALASRFLTTLGYTVVGASSGDEALTLAAQYEGKIDLVLTDLVMPGMGGRAVAHELQARYPHLRFLYMSGFSHDTDVTQRAVGEESVLLQKPFTLMGISRRVRQALDDPPVQPLL